MEYQFDFLVLGSGIAGLSYALKVARHGSVAVVTKKDKKETNTNYAQGGIATVLDPDDSFQLHVEDTIISGDGLCHQDVVQLVVRSGPERIRELVEIGVQFNRGCSARALSILGGKAAIAATASCMPRTLPAGPSNKRSLPPLRKMPTSSFLRIILPWI